MIYLDVRLVRQYLLRHQCGAGANLLHLESVEGGSVLPLHLVVIVNLRNNLTN